MDYKAKLDNEYTRIVQPLENSTIKSNTINGMIAYMELMGEAMTTFADTMNKHHKELVTAYPEKKEEIEKYIHQLKNKMISSYKPK